jgi:hypothetical protein
MMTTDVARMDARSRIRDISLSDFAGSADARIFSNRLIVNYTPQTFDNRLVHERSTEADHG